ncbi:MAG: TetR/AcrR family transcriptional regulator [Solirubrobacteraceae bacterium]
MEARVRNPRGEGERLRDVLLDAATDLLAELHDVDAMSVRAVTRRAGVSPTAMYLHFADKDELVTATKSRCFTALRDRIDAAAERTAADDPTVRLRAMGAAYLAFAREQPGWYAVCFHTRFGHAPDGCAVAEAPVTEPATTGSAVAGQAPGGGDAAATPADDGPGMDVFARLVEAVASCGIGDEPRALTVATVLWSALHGRVALERAMPDFPFPDEEPWIDRLTDLVRAARGDARTPEDVDPVAIPAPGGTRSTIR